MNKLLTSLILGINSGLAYALNVLVFTAYLNDSHISLALIGILSLRILPYSFKYLWSPIFDSIKLKFFPKNFGQRKSWIIVTQCFLTLSIIFLGIFPIKDYFYLVCIISFLTSFFAASYDIASQAYRIELASKDNLNKISFYNTVGFRIGFVSCGGGGLYLSSLVSWPIVFFTIAILIIPCIFIVAKSIDNKKITNEFNSKNIGEWFRQGFLKPFLVFFKQPYFYVIVLIISFYKISDSYIDWMLIPFLIDIGYSKTQIASISQTIGTVATLVGTGFGSYLITKTSILKCLFVAEILSGLTNLLFITLIDSNNSISLFIVISCIENFVSGICNIALISYMSILCDKKFTATHYAILVSISSFSKTLFSSSSGIIATKFGWTKFFLFSSMLSIPAIICILWLLIAKSKLKILNKFLSSLISIIRR